MNEVKLTGRVLSIYRDRKTDALVTKIAVNHDHLLDYGQTIRVESKFTTIMHDKDLITQVNAVSGDKVMITGYIKEDFTPSDHRKNMIYATNIKVVA